jgi:putative inorganic carbon (hco3(-)) transporter
MEQLNQNGKSLTWLYTAIISFGIVSVFSIISGSYLVLALPAILLVILIGLYRLDWLMFAAVVVTPLSINLAKTELGIGVSLPSEPIIFGIMLLFLFRILYTNGLDLLITYHPVSIAIYFHLAWMITTTLTSTLPLVSFKATLARFCFIIVFYFLASQVFRKIKNITAFMWCYIIPLLVVIGYATFNHALAGFTEKAAHTSMVPFYNDHTAYAAAIAMFVPVTFGLMGLKSASKFQAIMASLVAVILLTAIVLSYTRASWISLIAGLLCYLVFLFRIRTALVVASIITVVALFFIFQTQITMSLEQNEEQSSTDYASHVQSMSNISSDASNVERLNRWNSAFRMFELKPWFGWGPGTYMFQYAPYQKWSERTIISTNFGEGGNAHSEYIGPLAEQGVPGPLTFIAIGIIVLFRASRLFIQSKSPVIRMLVKSLVIGLVTYWVHGMLNNFLDTEKASVPFWAFIGAIVSLDIYHSRKRVSAKAATI